MEIKSWNLVPSEFTQKLSEKMKRNLSGVKNKILSKYSRQYENFQKIQNLRGDEILKPNSTQTFKTMKNLQNNEMLD